MNVLLTVCSGIAFVCCVWVFIRTQTLADESLESARQAESTAMKLRAERDRVTVAERELDALRRELRKLSGKFYALKQELDVEGADAENDVKPDEGWRRDMRAASQLALDAMTVCEQWAIAQRDGPSSPAARCECAYCTQRRAHRERQRNALVPKTVQGQATLAKVNAGKP